MTRANRNRILLLAVVLGFVVLCLVYSRLDQYYAYDEAIYLSQVYPVPALQFTAPRARGLPALLAPMGWLNAPVTAVRGYLLVINAGLMYIGFNAWLPVLGIRAVIAAAIFSVGWLPIFYATQVFPNLLVAFGTLAAAGYLARYLMRDRQSRAPLFACAVAIVFVTAIRPTEATFATAGLCLAVITRPGRELLLRWSVLIGALLIGWLPWVIEAYTRWGGVRERMHAAAQNIGGGLQLNIRPHLVNTSGGSFGGLFSSVVPRYAVAWWFLILVSVVVVLCGRLITGSRSDDRVRGATVAAIAGLATASQYLFLTAVLEARFLLPAYVLLTIVLVAAPPPRKTARHGRAPVLPRVAAGAVVVLLFVLLAHWQLGVTRRVEAHQYKIRLVGQRLTEVLRSEIKAKPCYVSSTFAFPVFAFATGCQGSTFSLHSTVVELPSQPKPELQRPFPVYVLTVEDPATTVVRPYPGSVRPLGHEGMKGWWLFIANPDQVTWIRFV